jgi:glycosyltransferase involved in cell wall biosynthesis
MKVGLVGSRVGYIDRGFETFTRNLFELVKNDVDITLFKGAGAPAAREVVIPCFWFEKGILSGLQLSRDRRLMIQERAYAFAMLPHLLRNRYDVIHFSEVVVSNGAPAPPLFYQFFDLIQEVTQVRLDAALAYGLPEKRLRLVPYGIDGKRFRKVSSAAAAGLRRKYRIPEDRFVVLCVAAIKKHHKRIDALIKEASGLDPGRYFLLVAGHRTEETPGIEQLATSMLASNYRFLTAPHESIHEIYQLADLFVLPSLTEGLGIVILEAMASSLPVVVHHDSSFRWVVGHADCLIDMSEPGILRRRIEALASSPSLRTEIADHVSRHARTRFDWQRLKPDYLALYRHAVEIDKMP